MIINEEKLSTKSRDRMKEKTGSDQYGFQHNTAAWQSRHAIRTRRNAARYRPIKRLRLR